MKELSPYLPPKRILPSVVNEASGSVTAPGDPSFRGGLLGHLHILHKHAWLIGAVFVGTVLFAALAVFSETPLYTATATLLIERSAPQVLDIQQIMPESFQDETETGYYKTQYELLKGRALAETVIKEEALEHSFLAARKTKRSGAFPDRSGR